ncbi:MAG: hypothetical protein ABIQ73_06510 [Acidimicrobiales bacterium]
MRRRLVASYLTITLVTLLLLTYPLGRTFSSRERDRLLRDVEHDATVVGSLAEDALEQGVLPPVDRVLATYARDPGGRIVVVDSRGKSVADFDFQGVTGSTSPIGRRSSPRSTAAAPKVRGGPRHSTPSCPM